MRGHHIRLRGLLLVHAGHDLVILEFVFLCYFLIFVIINFLLFLRSLTSPQIFIISLSFLFFQSATFLCDQYVFGVVFLGDPDETFQTGPILTVLLRV